MLLVGSVAGLRSKGHGIDALGFRLPEPHLIPYRQGNPPAARLLHQPGFSLRFQNFRRQQGRHLIRNISVPTRNYRRW